MLRFLIRRLLIAIPTMLLIATLAFGLLHGTPGGPFDSAKRIPPAIQHSIEAKYHLNDPLWQQYARYLSDLARGDLGPSYQYRDTSVNELIPPGAAGGCTDRLSGDAICDPAGRVLRHPGRGAARRSVGPYSDVFCGTWHRGTGVCHRASADPGLCHRAALVARGRLGTRLRALHDFAGDFSRLPLCGLHRPHGTL
jgi:hypothetical protein